MKNFLIVAVVIVGVLAFAAPAFTQNGLTAAELAKLKDPAWVARLQPCELVSRTGSVVQLKCPSSSWRYVTLDLESSTILLTESRESKVLGIVKWVVTIAVPLVGGAIACAKGRC